MPPLLYQITNRLTELHMQCIASLWLLMVQCSLKQFIKYFGKRRYFPNDLAEFVKVLLGAFRPLYINKILV